MSLLAVRRRNLEESQKMMGGRRKETKGRTCSLAEQCPCEEAVTRNLCEHHVFISEGGTLERHISAMIARRVVGE